MSVRPREKEEVSMTKRRKGGLGQSFPVASSSTVPAGRAGRMLDDVKISRLLYHDARFGGVDVYAGRYGNQRITAFSYRSNLHKADVDKYVHPAVREEVNSNLLAYFGHAIIDRIGDKETEPMVYYIYEYFEVRLSEYQGSLMQLGKLTKFSRKIQKGFASGIDQLRSLNSKHRALTTLDVAITECFSTSAKVGDTIKVKLMNLQPRSDQREQVLIDYESVYEIFHFCFQRKHRHNRTHIANDFFDRLAFSGRYANRDHDQLWIAFSLKAKFIFRHPVYWKGRTCISYIYKLGGVLKRFLFIRPHDRQSRKVVSQFMARFRQIRTYNWLPHFPQPLHARVKDKKLLVSQVHSDPVRFTLAIRNASTHLPENEFVKTQVELLPHPDRFWGAFDQFYPNYLIESYNIVDQYFRRPTQLGNEVVQGFFNEFLIRP